MHRIGRRRGIRARVRRQRQLDLTQTSHRILNNNRVIILEVDDNVGGHGRTLCEQCQRLEEEIALNNILLGLGHQTDRFLGSELTAFQTERQLILGRLDLNLVTQLNKVLDNVLEVK